MKVKITKLDESATLPQYKTAGAVAFDLSANTDMIIEPNQIAFIPTGLVIATPPGYALVITSRSSTPIKKGLTLPHGIGLIDQDYSGAKDEIKILIHNFTDKPVSVTKGERIAQGFFTPIERAEWIEGEANSESRGGFGSTGQ